MHKKILANYIFMDVFKPFLQRLAQPVILSFCIAWIFWNWEISIGFFKYNSESIIKYGYENYKELIVENTDKWRNYLLPMISAFLYPILRYGLNLFNTVIRTEERTKLLNVSGTGKMSTLKFLELKKSYDEKVVALSQYFEEQSEIQKRANQSDTELITLKNDLQKAQEDFSKQKQEELIKHQEELSKLQEEKHELSQTIQNQQYRENELYLENIEYKEQNKKLVDESFSYAVKASDHEMLVHDYLFKSSMDFLKSKYNITIYKNYNLDNVQIFSYQGEIICTESNIYSLIVDNFEVGIIKSYTYDIIQNQALVYFSGNSDIEEFSIILEKYLMFKLIDHESLLESEYAFGGDHYKVEFIKIIS